MVLFIDLNTQVSQGWERQFAWWDTITNQFIKVYSNQVWASWKEFENDYMRQLSTTGAPPVKYRLDRFLSLFPEPWPPVTRKQ